ncbi:hypothetical protein ScPMuIL_009644 [Solemya velum]
MCSEAPCLGKLALIVLIIGFVCATIAIFTPYWNEQDLGSKTKISGLISTCDDNAIGYCVGDINEVIASFNGTEFVDDFIATLSLQLGGWTAMLAGVIVMIVYTCLPNKILAIVGLILCLLSGGMIIASMVVYGIGITTIMDSVLSWSFGLDVAGGGLALIAGVIMIINSCIL